MANIVVVSKGRTRLVRARCMKRERIPGHPYFKGFSNRRWCELGFMGALPIHAYNITDASTGLKIAASEEHRFLAFFWAEARLDRLGKRVVLARIAAVKAGYRGKKATKRFKYRSR